MLLQVTDGGASAKTARVPLTVTILKNEKTPLFRRGDIFTTVPENAAPGYSVETVTATDADAFVSALNDCTTRKQNRCQFL